MKVYLGFDDTDNLGAPYGTGELVRRVSADLPQPCRAEGVERQQLLVHEGIIVAAASVGLTASGWAGRFMEFGDLRTLPETMSVSDFRPSALGQEDGKHFSVLPGDFFAQLGQDPCGHAQIHADVVDMAGPGAASPCPVLL